MGRHAYEYKLLVEYVNPEEPGRYPHLSHLGDQEALTRIMEDIFTHLPESIPEGWEVQSHNITASRNTLIITVLLRRPLVA